MQPLNLASSSVLKVFEHFDVDEFRSPLDSSLIRSVPTRAGRISAMQAVLALPHCEIYLPPSSTVNRSTTHPSCLVAGRPITGWSKVSRHA